MKTGSRRWRAYVNNVTPPLTEKNQNATGITLSFHLGRPAHRRRQLGEAATHGRSLPRGPRRLMGDSAKLPPARKEGSSMDPTLWSYTPHRPQAQKAGGRSE